MNVFTLMLGDTSLAREMLVGWIRSIFNASQNANIYLLTNIDSSYLTVDFSTEQKRKLVFLDYESYMAPLRSMNLYHDGINDANFELVCFKRFVVMNRVLNEYGLERLLHLGSDISVSSTLFELFNVGGLNKVYSPYKSSTYCSLWDAFSLKGYVDNIQKYDAECRLHKPARNSDMNYMKWLIDTQVVEFHQISNESNTQIHSLRSFLIKEIPPIHSFADGVVSEFEKFDKFSYEQLMEYYPISYLSEIISYAPLNGQWSIKLVDSLRPLDFIHFQGGGAKKYFVPFLNDKLSDI